MKQRSGLAFTSAGNKRPAPESEGKTPVATPAYNASATELGGKESEREPEDETSPEIDDRAALSALYVNCGGRLWGKGEWWMTRAPLGQWRGVAERDGRVVQLSLRDNNLKGEGVMVLSKCRDDVKRSIGQISRGRIRR